MDIQSWAPRRRGRRRQLLLISTIAVMLFTLYRLRGSAEDAFKGLQKSAKNSNEQPRWSEIIMGGRWDQEESPTPKTTNLTSHSRKFVPGTPHPLGTPYTKMVVLAHKQSEDVSWLTDIFPPGGDVGASIYTVDDPNAALKPPKNKGHEAMIYLTYIIDHYDSLSDVSIFLHAHRQAWHNNELLGHDAVQLISRLNADRVVREGYMNLRCHWEPGCPAWMHPGNTIADISKQEQALLAQAWKELFPVADVPTTLAQPCCAQFAASRERLQSLSKGQYVFFRDWILSTELDDEISGRVWEYLWQYVLTGQEVVCPKPQVCYCDGFGVCFGGEAEYEAWWDRLWDRRTLEGKLKEWEAQEVRYLKGKREGKKESDLDVPWPGMDVQLRKKIQEQKDWLDAELRLAKERGNHWDNRAKEA